MKTREEKFQKLFQRFVNDLEDGQAQEAIANQLGVIGRDEMHKRYEKFRKYYLKRFNKFIDDEDEEISSAALVVVSIIQTTFK